MKRIGLILMMILAGNVMLLAQDLRENFSRSLFADQKASHVGESVTIYITENSSASNTASTSTSRSSNLSLTGTGTNGNKSLLNLTGGVTTGNTFAGSGATSTQGSITATLSARVDSVLPNGNLFIRGSRIITINGEEQTIKISGIIRTSDIQADNSVYSYNISDANISFQGNGIVSRVQEPGWLTKFFHWLF
ncbi:MAG TPA: flagellar basal body L-ring protein FlgH [Bacteroidota bacterium]|nr:flagellar basal body L-ring protein FlgH [Bacteroidota bacterium]